jgi:hypothetical protein
MVHLRLAIANRPKDVGLKVNSRKVLGAVIKKAGVPVRPDTARELFVHEQPYMCSIEVDFTQIIEDMQASWIARVYWRKCARCTTRSMSGVCANTVSDNSVSVLPTWLLPRLAFDSSGCFD